MYTWGVIYSVLLTYRPCAGLGLSLSSLSPSARAALAAADHGACALFPAGAPAARVDPCGFTQTHQSGPAVKTWYQTLHTTSVCMCERPLSAGVSSGFIPPPFIMFVILSRFTVLPPRSLPSLVFSLLFVFCSRVFPCCTHNNKHKWLPEKLQMLRVLSTQA